MKARAQMMSAVSCATVPKITVVMGGSYGPSGFAMVRERGGEKICRVVVLMRETKIIKCVRLEYKWRIRGTWAKLSFSHGYILH